MTKNQSEWQVAQKIFKIKIIKIKQRKVVKICICLWQIGLFEDVRSLLTNGIFVIKQNFEKGLKVKSRLVRSLQDKTILVV